MIKLLKIEVSDLKKTIPKLSAGDRILLCGTIYTARDAAHKRLFELLDSGKELPFGVSSSVIYYAGPTPAQPGMAVGSCGPTTSSRMDGFAPRLYDLGLAATIGKGERSAAVSEAIVRNRGVYLCAVGGAGALLARHILSAEEIAFSDLGCESIKIMTVNDLPLYVGIDCIGRSIFHTEKPCSCNMHRTTKNGQ